MEYIFLRDKLSQECEKFKRIYIGAVQPVQAAAQKSGEYSGTKGN